MTGGEAVPILKRRINYIVQTTEELAFSVWLERSSVVL